MPGWTRCIFPERRIPKSSLPPTCPISCRSHPSSRLAPSPRDHRRGLFCADSIFLFSLHRFLNVFSGCLSANSGDSNVAFNASRRKGVRGITYVSLGTQASPPHRRESAFAFFTPVPRINDNSIQSNGNDREGRAHLNRTFIVISLSLSLLFILRVLFSLFDGRHERIAINSGLKVYQTAISIYFVYPR